ncbi:MAG: TonB-dependent receptor [Flavobacteriales bacterium]|nr:TonB-dependent receptor [Flavobacteriales bacterium]
MGAFLLSNWTFSQANYGEIRGKVIDKKTKTAMEYATVVLKREGIVKSSSLTDDNGNYFLKTLDPGEYQLEVSYVGYRKYEASGILVTSASIKFWNIEMLPLGDDGFDLGTVTVAASRTELVNVDENKKTLTSKDIMKLPQRGIGAISNTSSGTNSSGGGISILGNRTDGTRLFIDGVPVIGSSAMPTVGQEQIDLIQSGVPAMFGDLTGGAINITTKGPSRRHSKYFEYVTSSLFDKWHYNTFELAFSGPLKIKNKGGGKDERVLFGYNISGHLEYQKDGSPTVLGSWAVKDDVFNNIKENPLTENPQGGGFVPTSSFLTKDDLVLNKARQNVPFYLGVVNTKFEYTPSKNSVLTFFGSFAAQQSKGYNYASSLLNFDEYSLNTNQTYRAYLRYTQKIGYQSGDKLEKGAKQPLVSDAFYSLRIDYQSSNSKSQHEKHRDNIFDYGYIGKFTHYRAPVYEYKDQPQKYIITRNGVNDTVTRVGYYELRGFRDTMITYEASDLNPLRSKYTENAYSYFSDAFGLRGATSDGMIATFNGLLNGYSLPNTYSLWFNPGMPLAGYSKSQSERFSAYAIGEASINTGKKKENKHDIQFGLTYEQNIQSSYGLSASRLWFLMPQITNSHLSNLDKVTQGEYILNSIQAFDQDGRFLDSVKYNVRVDKDQQTEFDKNLRAKLISEGKTDAYGNPITESSYIDINALSPEDLDLSMFSADDLLNKNSASNPYISYYGYDYLGNRTRKRFSVDDFLLNKQERSIGSFAPIYSAAWLQDKFAIKDMIFRVGVRIERYDANQPVLKDPYSLYPIKTAGEITEIGSSNVNHPDNIGDDYAVYVNSAKNPTKIVGYRKDNTWYDAQGVQVTNPEVLAQQTSNNLIQPYLVDYSNTNIVKEAFVDYKPQVNVLPRVWFSFPINKDALFFANYDVLTQRPTDGATFAPIRSYYFLESDQDRFLPNAALKPRIKTMYELGYKQKLSKTSAISIIASYSEVRNDFGQFRYNQAYPVSYTSYSNIDFSTNKAFRAEYQYRGIKNFQMNANYTLLFADGTGSNINAQSALIQANQPNLRSLYPLDVDFRHNFNTTFTYGYEGGKDYNGPIWWGKRVFENAEASFIVLARSGAPYTANLSPTATAQARLGTVTRSQVKGNPFGSRMPWQFKADVNFSKSFEFKKKQVKENRINVTGVTVFLWVQNLFNTKIIESVYAFTGLPNDDGYLNSPLGEQAISQQVNQQSFIDLYNISMNNPFNYASPRLIRLGLRFTL